MHAFSLCITSLSDRWVTGDHLDAGEEHEGGSSKELLVYGS